MSDTPSDAGHVEAYDSALNGSFSSSEHATTGIDPSQSSEVDASADAVQQQESAVGTQNPEQSDRNKQAPNGHSASESPQQNGAPASADLEEGSADSGAPQEQEEEPWRKRLYFVRMPKFPEDNQYALKALQEEIDVYRSQVQLLNESMNVVRMQRDSAKESVAEARESMNAATNAFQAKQREVEPLQTGKRNQSELQRNVQTEFRDLEVRSEQELDAKIREMEHHMAHESIPIAQERQMVKHIKKLRDSRQRVRQYEDMYAGVESARAAVRSGQTELKELQQERQVLFEEKQLRQTIFNKHRDELQSLDAKMNEIRDERTRVKEQQDRAYHRLQGIRQQSRGKKDAYYQNRRFSQDVRKLIREGKLDEARRMCEEQTDAALGHLQSDSDWRQEYLDLWMHQRPPPYRITFDDYDFDEVPKQDGQEGSAGKGKGKGGKGAAKGGPPAPPPLTGKEKAQAIIEAAFAEVKQDMARKSNTGSAASEIPGSEPFLPPPPTHPQPVVGSDPKAEAKPPKPSKPAPKPTPKPAELPLPEDKAFIPPPIAAKEESKSEPEPDPEAAAAAAREKQARAQQEAQQRREKAAQRKQKAGEKRKAQEAERKAAAKAEAAAQQQSLQSEAEGTDAEESEALATASDATATASSAVAAVADKVPAAVKDSAAQVSKAANKAVSNTAKKSEGLKRKLEAPKARGVRKKSWQSYARQCSKSVKQWSEGHKPELGLIAIVVVFIGMALFVWNRSNSAVKAQDITS